MATKTETLHRLTTKEVSENSAAVLKGAASNPELWEAWLSTVAFHPSESANNCAAIMASPYEDKRELRNQAAWAMQGGSVLEGESGIPLVHRSKSGNFFVDVVFPVEAIEGANKHRYRGLPAKIDLEDEVDGPAYSAAMAKWSSELASASRNALWIVATRHGLETSVEPELPSSEVIADAKQLVKYCADLKKEASDLIFRIDKTFEATRRNIMNPVIRRDEPNEDESLRAAPAVEGAYDMESPSISSSSEVGGVTRDAFDASSHTATPSTIYSMAAKIAADASASESMGSSVGHAQ